MGREDGDENKGGERRAGTGQHHPGERQLNGFYWPSNGVMLQTPETGPDANVLQCIMSLEKE